MLEGVDVSWVQGNYRPGGEDFVIVNASRANVGLAVGSMYRAQVANARAAGKHVGHYFFNGNVDPVRCADFFVDNLSYQSGDSLWLDVEAEPGTGTAAWNPGQALAFLSRVRSRLGVMPGVYLNKSLMDGMNWSAVVAAGAPLWIAYYNPSPPPIRWWPSWTVWQYTSTPMDRNKAVPSLTTASTMARPIVEEEEDYSMTQGAFYRLAPGQPALGSIGANSILYQKNPGEPLLPLNVEWAGYAANKNQFVDFTTQQLQALVNLVGIFDTDPNTHRRVPAVDGRAAFDGFSVYLP